jgi:diadenosine tetraphosphate (Ap4A) HIT family hydrolase
MPVIIYLLHVLLAASTTGTTRSTATRLGQNMTNRKTNHHSCRRTRLATMLLDRSVFLVGGACVSIFSMLNYKNHVPHIPLQQQQQQQQHDYYKEATSHEKPITPSISIPPKTAYFHIPPQNSIVVNNRSYQSYTTTTTTTTTKYNRTIDPSLVQFYQDNDSIFGSILRGEEPASIFTESDHLLMFQDNKPRAPLHGLIIPKRRIDSVLYLTKDDLPMLYEMKQMANEIINKYNIMSSTSSSTMSSTMSSLSLSQSHDRCQVRMVFHIPPFYSVKHLHLHVLAPVEDMNWFYRVWKYPSSETRWCTKLDSVIQRLEHGQPPVPYHIGIDILDNRDKSTFPT